MKHIHSLIVKTKQAKSDTSALNLLIFPGYSVIRLFLIGATPYLRAVSKHTSLEGGHRPKKGINSPNNRSQPEESSDTAEHKRNDTPRRKASRQRCNGPVLAGQVVKVFCVARCIARRKGSTGRTHVVVVLRDRQTFLQIDGSFDHYGCEARVHVPFDVAVEEPDSYTNNESMFA
jgi:hypothetical protein